MPTISRSVDITAPTDQVWRLLEDVRRLPEFSANTIEVTDAPARITSVGQTYTQVGKVLGKRYASQWRVTALDPGRRIESEGTVAAGVRYCLTQRLEPREDGSRLSIRIDYRVPGGLLGRVAAKAGLESVAAREAQAVLDGIRAVVEGAGSG